MALGLLNRKVLYVPLEEPVSLRVLALGLPGREVLHVTLEVHILSRALALELPGMEVPCLLGARFPQGFRKFGT